MTTYATGEQLAAWLQGGDYEDAVPDDPARLLARATEVIADATFGLVELDSETLLPTDAAVGLVLADATCAQVEQWFEVGEENDIVGFPAGTKMQLGAGAVTALPDTLAPRAARILRRNGLTPVDEDGAQYTVELV